MSACLKSCRLGAVVFLALTLGAGKAMSFGPTGHKTIAYIAQDRLSPGTQKRVTDILGYDDDMASVANWADVIKTFQEETKPWHSINLPIRRQVMAAQVMNFCPNNDCVIAQIRIKKGDLTNPATSAKDKLRALKFIIHLVGDLHQPLDVADDDDQGGNDKQVRFQNKKMKLHGLWEGLIEKKATEDPREFASSLENGITKAKAKAWMEGDEVAWALEGYKIAKGTIYQGYAPGAQDLTGTNLSNAYYNKMRPIVEEQIQKAGVRLAKVLEEIFGEP